MDYAGDNNCYEHRVNLQVLKSVLHEIIGE